MKKSADTMQTQSSDQLMHMAENELMMAESKLEEAIAHLSSASRYHKKAMLMSSGAEMPMSEMHGVTATAMKDEA
jgi:hypothetical protein